MHLDEARLARLVDGELGGEESAVRGHLAECADCRRRALEAREGAEAVGRRLAALDHPAPAVSAASIAARARVQRREWRWAWAAAAVLAVGAAGAAWAAPGSPLPGLVRELVRRVGGTAGRESAPEGPVAGPDLAADAGIAVEPGASLMIEFLNGEGGGAARVSLVDLEEVVIRGPAGAATFTTDESRLVVEQVAAPAAFDVLIPRTARRVEIRARGTQLFLKDGDRVSAAVAPVDGLYHFPLP